MFLNNFKKWIGILKAWFDGFKELKKLKRLGKVLGLSNIICFCVFIAWYTKHEYSYLLNFCFYSLLVIHASLSFLFIRSSSIYGGSKWVLWAWLSLIIFSPFGIVLIYYCSLNIYWEVDEEKIKNKDLNSEPLVSLFNDQLNVLEKRWMQATDSLHQINPEVFNAFITRVLQVKDKKFENWDVFQISTVIAMFLSIKQFKQKTYDNMLWEPHWYDNQHFTFGIKNHLPLTKKNPYAITMGIIVLDELNNYQKILDAKVEIKNNLKFSQAKMICLHWGKEYKIYTNL